MEVSGEKFFSENSTLPKSRMSDRYLGKGDVEIGFPSCGKITPLATVATSRRNTNRGVEFILNNSQ